jgi:hypothetical protein
MIFLKRIKKAGQALIFKLRIKIITRRVDPFSILAKRPFLFQIKIKIYEKNREIPPQAVRAYCKLIVTL